jgi:DNA-binding IclR family transcriptional regulator
MPGRCLGAQMPRAEVREIMDELTRLGGMTPAHMARVAKLRTAGNAIVPQVAAEFIKAAMI